MQRAVNINGAACEGSGNHTNGVTIEAGGQYNFVGALPVAFYLYLWWANNHSVGLTWGGVWLVGLLAGIGFTMSIFIAMLAFTDESLRGAAKLGVLGASLAAGAIGLAWGGVYTRRLRRATALSAP